MVTVEDLYKNFGILADAKDKIGEHTKEYLEILSAVKGGPNEKRLASQFIARFFKYFPTLAEQAIDAHLDLCEDDDLSIRKQAIKDLPTLCKDTKEHLPKIADVMTQLLQTDDSNELSVVQSSLMSLFKIDAKGTLGGLFAQILGGEDLVRDRAIKFLAAKLKSLSDEVMTKEVEDYLLLESRKVLHDVTADEFIAFIHILSGLKTMSTVQGRQQLIDIIIDQADLDKDFEPADADCVDKLMQCIKQATPFFSKNVQSTKFVSYLCQRVLPVLSEIQSPEEGVDLQLEMLKLLAELSAYCGDMDEHINLYLETIFNKFLEYMPLPPTEISSENSTPNEEPKLHFSYVECLMFSFHQLGKKKPEFLTDENQADRLKDFRLRLQFFAHGIQGYIKKLREALQGKTSEELRTEENKIKVVALKTTSNINTLIKDLFHNPPSYKSIVSLSWRSHSKQSSSSPGSKRHTPITFDTCAVPPSSKRSSTKQERPLYSPPSGKYSEKAGNFPQSTWRGQQRGRSYGSWRGRRRSGRWF